MIKNDVIQEVSKKTGVSRFVVGVVIDATIEIVTKSVCDGHPVQFSNFGTFAPKLRAARTGRNPHTGEAVPIPERIVPLFTPGKGFREAINKLERSVCDK